MKRKSHRKVGSRPSRRSKLVDNAESWLDFTDLVFIDPIGTGLSRMIEEEKSGTPKEGEKKEGPAEKYDEKEYFKVNRDLASIGEFVRKFLTRHRRWETPIFIAGESYGGFRTACLAKRLQEEYGVGLNGVIIISPALEFVLLTPSDYDIQSWAELFPTMAAAAAYHGRSRVFSLRTPLTCRRKKASRPASETSTSASRLARS